MNAPRDLQHDFFDMLMESQFWSPAQITAYQRGELEQLLRHAKANVPFYETRLDCVFDRHGNIDWNRWHEIPIVKRSDLTEHRDRMRARLVPTIAGRIGKSQSSGTTGVATETLQTELSMRLSSAALVRAYDWHNLDYRKTMVGFAVESPAEAAWPDGAHRGPWIPRWRQAHGVGHLYEINRATPPGKVLEFIGRHGANYIAGGTVRAQALALEAMRLGVHHDIEVVLTRGAAVTDECRSILGEAFGARAVGLYSAKESHKMAHPCPATESYHVNAEMLLLEVVDPLTEEPVPAGTVGKIVVTPFYNLAQPLVRYDIGDLGVLGERCSCGRTLPVLQEILGRQLHMFIMPDGTKMVPSLPNAETRRLNAAMWQMAQVGPNEIEIRRVPLPDSPAPEKEELTAIVRQCLWPAVSVRFVDVDGLHLPPSGKLIQYSLEWGSSKAAT